MVRAADLPWLVVVLTGHSEEVPPHVPVWAWLAELGRAWPAERIMLPPLTRAQTDALLGTSSAPRPAADWPSGSSPDVGVPLGNPVRKP